MNKEDLKLWWLELKQNMWLGAIVPAILFLIFNWYNPTEKWADITIRVVLIFMIILVLVKTYLSRKSQKDKQI